MVSDGKAPRKNKFIILPVLLNVKSGYRASCFRYQFHLQCVLCESEGKEINSPTCTFAEIHNSPSVLKSLTAYTMRRAKWIAPSPPSLALSYALTHSRREI